MLRRECKCDFENENSRLAWAKEYTEYILEFVVLVFATMNTLQSTHTQGGGGGGGGKLKSDNVMEVRLFRLFFLFLSACYQLEFWAWGEWTAEKCISYFSIFTASKYDSISARNVCATPFRTVVCSEAFFWGV